MKTRSNSIAIPVMLAASLILATITTIDCSQRQAPPISNSPSRQLQYSQVYRDTSGTNTTYYTRTCDSDGNFWFWMWLANSSSGYSTPSTSSSRNFSGGSWTRVLSIPSGASPTKDVVKDEEGKPTEEEEAEQTVPEQEVITENTTEQQEQAMENEGGHSVPEAENESETPSTETSSSSESSSSSGDSGGGDSGGGGDGGGSD